MFDLRKGMKTKFSYAEAKTNGQIDELCIPICDIFNELGMPTLFCCQGHEEGDCFNIIFETAVGDDEIITFLKFVRDVKPDVTYGGNFSKWYRYDNEGILLVNWMYYVTGTLNDIKESVVSAETLFRKAANYVRDVLSKDNKNVIVYPGKANY